MVVVLVMVVCLITEVILYWVKYQSWQIRDSRRGALNGLRMARKSDWRCARWSRACWRWRWKGPMGLATKQPALHIGSVPIKTGKIYFYSDMYSTDIVSTGTISVISNGDFVTSAPPSKMFLLSISLPACEAPTEENHGEGTIFYGYVDQTIDLSIEFIIFSFFGRL